MATQGCSEWDQEEVDGRKFKDTVAPVVAFVVRWDIGGRGFRFRELLRSSASAVFDDAGADGGVKC